jgi:predicted membrane-bound spermidine synthase
VVWTRYLALFLGHTSYAVVAVLVAFMGGLAAGNAWLGARADRTAKPLALYAWLEVGISAYALLFPAYYHLCHSVFISLASRFEPGTGPLLLLKFLFSLVTVLLPTTLMGATFPALTRFVTRALSELREKVGALYFINSFGAVLGCLLADFWWIPQHGLQWTVFVGAALNLTAGLVALFLSKRIGEGRAEVVPTPEVPGGDESFSVIELRLALVGIGLSGFVAMLYEVAWTRFLALALGATTHAFSLMLATFISGITVGAWIIYQGRRVGRSLEAFAWAELALAVTLLASMPFYAGVPYWFVKGASLLSRQPASYAIYEMLQALICFGVMFVPATCLGLTLPLVSRIATVELAHTGRSVGRVFAVNTLGTVLGAVVTGLWLMPWLGLPRTFALGIILNSLIGLGILFRNRVTARRLLAVPIVALCFIWGIGVAFNEEWQGTLSLGLWRTQQPPANLEAFREEARARKILYHCDGAGSTVAVTSERMGANETLRLKVNGKTDAASAVDVTTQRLLGHIPMLLRPSSKEALVVGLGSGMTAAAVARHSSIQHVDIVEISPEVVEAARLFADYNDRFWENPKIKVTVEDAKSFLKISSRRYDAIISEPSNPWMAGVAGVFSKEYYEDCRARLETNGVMAQWVQTYETSDALLDVVLRTFGSVFPYMSIWQTSTADLVLVGSSQPLQVNLDAMLARFLERPVSVDLKRIELVSFPAFLAREVISQQNGAYVTLEPGRIHSDFYPILEFEAAKAFFAFGGANRWRLFDENLSTRPATLLGEYLKKHPLTEDDLKGMGRFYLEYRLPESDMFRTLLIRWEREQPGAFLPIELTAQTPYQATIAELEMLRLAPTADALLKLAEKDAEPLRQYEAYLMQTYRGHRSVFNQPPSDLLENVLRRLLQTNPANQRVYKCHLAEIAWDRGDDDACAELANSAMDPSIAKGGPGNFSIDPKAPQLVLFRRMDTLWRSGKFEEARALSQVTKRLGLFGNNPVLDMMCRKVDRPVTRESSVPE